MQFDDCAVSGCDASILIESTKNQSSEKDAPPNLTLRGFELIDEIKESLEDACPSTVSCADIVTLATRDTVALAGGPNYIVPTDRRDSLASNVSQVNIVGPSASEAEALEFFRTLGFNLHEMVTLLGAHTVGFAHCFLFDNRLSNFEGNGKPDPSMDSNLRAKLLHQCNVSKSSSSSLDHDLPKVFLEQNTPFLFDNQFYKQILLNKGILQIDQELALDNSTAPVVSRI